MPRIDITKAPFRKGAGKYPKPFRRLVEGREKRSLGNAAGLTQFGVHLTRLKPGAASALRHWHEQEDEFVYVLEGALILIENEGETPMRAGEAAGFKAGVADGHHFVNRSQRDAVFLVVGTRAPEERVHYPDDDLVYNYDGVSYTFTRQSGKPYSE
ncbi:MAG: cupin domain-containing protein [Xanthobacteraceae bacterium]